MCSLVEALTDSRVVRAASQVEEVQVQFLITHCQLLDAIVDSHCWNVLGHKLLVTEPAMVVREASQFQCWQ